MQGLPPQAVPYNQYAPAGLPPPGQQRKVAVTATGHGDEAYRQAKRRKATDRTIPLFTTSSATDDNAAMRDSDAALAGLSASYATLTQLERKLDWTLARKKAELSDLLGHSGTHVAAGLPGGSSQQPGKVPRVKRTLRLQIKTVWETSAAVESDQVKEEDVDMSSSGGPTFTLKLSGALLDVSPVLHSRVVS